MATAQPVEGGAVKTLSVIGYSGPAFGLSASQRNVDRLIDLLEAGDALRGEYAKWNEEDGQGWLTLYSAGMSIRVQVSNRAQFDALRKAGKAAS